MTAMTIFIPPSPRHCGHAAPAQRQLRRPNQAPCQFGRWELRLWRIKAIWQEEFADLRSLGAEAHWTHKGWSGRTKFGRRPEGLFCRFYRQRPQSPAMLITLSGFSARIEKHERHTLQTRHLRQSWVDPI